MKFPRIAFIIFIAAVLVGGGAWLLRKPGSSATDILVSPSKGPFEVVVTTSGELRARRSTEIMGPRRARDVGIRQIQVNWLIAEGTVVKEGDLVARLDQSELLNKIQDVSLSRESAQAEFTSAKLDTALELSKARNQIVNLRYDLEEKKAEMEQSRYEAPATQQKVRIAYDKAQRTLDQAIANYQKEVDQAKAKVRTKELELNKAQGKLAEYQALQQEFIVTAPAPGMVIYDREWDGRKVATGSSIGTWNPVVATLPDLTEMESITYVNEIDIQKVKEGQEVVIGLDAVAGKELKGTVSSVANIGEKRPNSDAKVFEVVITVADQDTTLRPAMTTSNQIVVARAPEVTYLPLECLHSRDSSSFVFVQSGGRVQKQEVKTGLINENDAEIQAGISLEDKVFLSLPEDTSGLVLMPLGNGK